MYRIACIDTLLSEIESIEAQKYIIYELRLKLCYECDKPLHGKPYVEYYGTLAPFRLCSQKCKVEFLRKIFGQQENSDSSSRKEN